MTGKRPYRGKNKNAIRDKILAEQASVEITEGCAWDDYPPAAADFINQCILKDQKARLDTLDKVKKHPWFEGFDWDGCVNQTMEPLYVPANDIDKNVDKKNAEIEFDDQAALGDFIDELKKKSGQAQFKEYYFDIDNENVVVEPTKKLSKA